MTATEVGWVTPRPTAQLKLACAAARRGAELSCSRHRMVAGRRANAPGPAQEEMSPMRTYRTRPRMSRSLAGSPIGGSGAVEISTSSLDAMADSRPRAVAYIRESTEEQG